MASEAFSSLPPKSASHESRFLMTDGGLTLFSPQTARSEYLSLADGNPYNSSMFRHAASDRRPQFFVQKFVTNEIIPMYDVEKVKEIKDVSESASSEVVVSDAGAEGKGEEAEEGSGSGSGDQEDGCDDEGSGDEEIPEIVYKTEPASLYLAKPVLLDVGGKQYLSGLAGVHLEPKHLQGNLLEATRSASASEWSCANATEIVCYLIDTSANILASNQELLEVKAGEFLGRSDPQLMQQLLEADQLFEATHTLNYQALCPDDIECSLGVRSVVAPTLNAMVYAIQNFMQVSYGGNCLDPS